jgi:hypothetical protein
MTDKHNDSELEAIRAVMAALTPLEPEARRRVIEYVFSRLGLTETGSLVAGLPTGREGAAGPQPSAALVRQEDIRSFKETKAPGSATEMAAVTAYYLAELAPPAERKDSITPQDVRKYFKQAGYPLPSRVRNPLLTARTAGYLDETGDRGVYRLNAVGYNLVAHTLPRADKGGSMARPGGRGRKRVPAGKPARQTSGTEA